MTELQFYKFVQGKEHSWHGDDLQLWLEHYDVKEFAELVGDHVFEEGGVEVHMLQGGAVCIFLNDILEMHEIEPENILSIKQNVFT